MNKYITTHKELLKLDGKSITCKIGGKYIDDAKIIVQICEDGEYIHICQNLKDIGCTAKNKFGYRYSLHLSNDVNFYEDDNVGVTEIQLKENMITLEEYKTQNIVINTRTQEEYDSFKKFIKKEKNIWISTLNLFSKGGNKALKEKLCLSLKDLAIGYSRKGFYIGEGYTIITPNQLKEYNEFVGKEEGKTFHTSYVLKSKKCVNSKYTASWFAEEDEDRLCQCGMCKVKIEREDGYEFIVNEKEYVEFMEKEELPTIGSNTPAPKDGLYNLEETVTIPASLFDLSNISMKNSEIDNRYVIKAPKENVLITVGQAIDWMQESEENVIEYQDGDILQRFKARIIDNILECFEGKEWLEDDVANILRDWTKIKKHIEPKQAEPTLKELMEAKEPFTYKDKQYRFDRNGAVITQEGHNVNLWILQEILTTIGN